MYCDRHMERLTIFFCPLITFVLLFFLFLNTLHSQLIFPQPNPVCPFYTLNTQIDYVPQPLSSFNSTTLCPPRSTQTCCRQEYQNQISQLTDHFSVITRRVLSNVTSQCSTRLTSLSCAVCASDSMGWVQVLSAPTNSSSFIVYKMSLCWSYCLRLFEDCNSSLIQSTGISVASSFSSAELFCIELFHNSSIIVNVPSQTELTCYDPEAPVCTWDDMTYYYTDCTEGRRQLLFNWKYNITCRGGDKLPSTRYNLPCPIYCSSGTYLPLGETTCQTCRGGTYSLGGGVRIDRWSRWPTRDITFTTYCTNRYNIIDYSCSGWILQDTYVSSNISGLSSRKCILRTDVEVKHDNSTVSFLAQVDSEYNYDKLFFDIDGKQTWIENTIEPSRSTFDLSPGFHTLRWIYQKDASLNVGNDAATIYMIEITGLSDHSDYCSQCNAGTTSTDHASECTPCPDNTYSNTTGSIQCTDCTPDEYSFSGSTKCSPRLACVSSDYHSFYSPCSYNLTRTLMYDWNTPKICKEADIHLPPIQYNLSCAPCNPGEYRNGPDCLFCSSGSYSNNQSNCEYCPLGSYAPKELSLHSWDRTAYGFSTECVGECGTPGWRLMGNYLDSGTNHGLESISFFTISTVIDSYPSGHVQYTFSFNCTWWCYVELYDELYQLQIDWNEIDYSSDIIFTSPKFDLKPGGHNLTWAFGKYSYGRNDDKAMIYSIVIDGVEVGGATGCVVCPNGTYSNSSSDTCTKCFPGSYSYTNSTNCFPCPENTFQDLSGADFCKPCGTNTFNPPGSSYCLENCTIVFNSSGDVYDIHELMNTDNSMYGPIVEQGIPPYYFYISPCKKLSQTSLGHPSIDADGNVVNTYALYIEGDTGNTVDLGHVVGYHLYQGPQQQKGIVLEFTQGTPGCGIEAQNMSNIPRRLNVSLVCDPTVGVGVPQAEGSIYTGTTYPNVCTYNLMWKSVYGCPICTEKDYTTVAGACIGGEQQVRYIWNTNPKICHGGVSLPTSFTRTCIVITQCPTGQYFGTGGICYFCPVGEYSLGNGELFDFSFNYNLSSQPFSTGCSGNCTSKWSSTTDGILSGQGTSWLELTESFISPTQSEVSFEYQYFSHLFTPFVFFIDAEEVLRLDDKTSVDTTSSSYVIMRPYTSFTRRLSSGMHILRWVYTSHGLTFTGQHPNYVKIRSITLRGSAHGLAVCKKCQPGWLSTDDRGSCVPCPRTSNAVVDSVTGLTTCEQCNTYRLLGQFQCLPQPPCKSSDFVEVYPQRCNTTSIFYRLTPSICQGDTPAGTTIKKCLTCPTGKMDVSGECKACPPGSYLTLGNESYICKPTNPGYITVSVSHYFNDDVVTEVPTEFSTQCSGECTQPGWRIFATYADSGLHFGESESILLMQVDLDHQYYETPNISFTLTFTPLNYDNNDNNNPSYQNSGVEVYINRVLQNIPFALQPNLPRSFANLPLPSTRDGEPVVVEWIYYQGVGDGPSVVKLSNVRVVGSKNGGATQQIPCPSGTRSDMKNHCLSCEPGTYAPEKSTQCFTCPEGMVSMPKSANCEVCGNGTIPSYSRNNCKATCTYVDPISGATYDFTPLKSNRIAVMPNTDNVESIKYQSFEIQLCDKFISDDCLTDCFESSYIFGEFGDETPRSPRTLGTWFEVIPAPVDSSSSHTFSIVYTRGKYVPLGCTSVRTTIHFYCSLSEGKGLPSLKPSFEKNRNCEPVFEWKSLYACRNCTKEDEVTEYGPCEINSRQKMTRFKVPCYDSVKREPSSESCNDIEVALTTVIITSSVSLILLLFIAGCAFYFFHQKRKMEVKYALLKTEVNANEEGDQNL